jgi:fructooligosaccharide transport system substrate-binding protein
METFLIYMFPIIDFMNNKIKILGKMFVLSLFLVACKGSNDGISLDENGNEVRLVKVWLHKSEAEDEGKTYLAIADKFNEGKFQTSDGRGIRVRFEFKNSGDALQTAINAEVIAGGLPDIIAIDSPNIAAYADAGIIDNIDKYITSEEKSDYVDSVIKQGTINNKLYALSGMDAPVGLYYNKELLQSIGVNNIGTVSSPWTWDYLNTVMAQLKNAGKPHMLKANLGFGGDEGAMYLYSSMVYSAHGEFNGQNGKTSGYFDSPNTVKGIKMAENIFKTYPDGTPVMYTGVSLDALAAGECAFEIYGPWGIDSIKKNYPSFSSKYGIMPPPVYSNGSDIGTVSAGCGSWGFAVTTSARNLEASSVVLKYITGSEASEMLYDSIGTFPTHKSILNSKTDFTNPGPLNSLADILVNAATPRPTLVNYPKLSLSFSKSIAYIEAKYGAPDYDLLKYIKELIISIDR